MMLRPVIGLLVALAMAPAVHAADQSEDGASCDGNTFQMVECLKAKTAQWDNRLNAAYQKAVQDAQPAQREQLRAAQRLWVQYRDANCLYYGMGEGTIARLDAVECMRSMTEARAKEFERPRPPVTTGKSQTELTQIADDALRGQPGCATASVPDVCGLPNVREGRNWEIPNVILGDSLISDVDRAVMSVHRQLGRKYHLVGDRD